MMKKNQSFSTSDRSDPQFIIYIFRGRYCRSVDEFAGWDMCDTALVHKYDLHDADPV